MGNSDHLLENEVLYVIYLHNLICFNLQPVQLRYEFKQFLFFSFVIFKLIHIEALLAKRKSHSARNWFPAILTITVQVILSSSWNLLYD